MSSWPTRTRTLPDGYRLTHRATRGSTVYRQLPGYGPDRVRVAWFLTIEDTHRYLLQLGLAPEAVQQAIAGVLGREDVTR